MPFKIIKNKEPKNTYKVLDKKRVISKHTSLVNAKKQIRLIEAIDHNKYFV